MIVLATTCAPHKLDEGFYLKWLEHFEAMQESIEDDLVVFIALEIDRRGIDVYAPMRPRLDEAQATIWTFGIDTQPYSLEPFEVNSGNRLVRICTGRNLAAEYAMTIKASHILYLDTDTEPVPDCLPKLLEVDRPLVYGHVPTYNLDGPVAHGLPGDCRQHWSSAGFSLVRRDAFRHVHWGWDVDDGKTDDPAFARAVELIGKAQGLDWSPITRHDVEGKHWPPSIVPLEDRDVDRYLR